MPSARHTAVQRLQNVRQQHTTRPEPFGIASVNSQGGKSPPRAPSRESKGRSRTEKQPLLEPNKMSSRAAAPSALGRGQEGAAGGQSSARHAGRGPAASGPPTGKGKGKGEPGGGGPEEAQASAQPRPRSHRPTRRAPAATSP